jgi:hypothetical protein
LIGSGLFVSLTGAPVCFVLRGSGTGLALLSELFGIFAAFLALGFPGFAIGGGTAFAAVGTAGMGPVAICASVPIGAGVEGRAATEASSKALAIK